eukprot:TRINITY_DN8198_c0_g1_i1.p1 TRINITY_DN8198_c0_g1~~TRINITY_DN8198_c0_g1_i1.p1  ORF type:complete len:684 (-),score=165.67 TRINITY_DN8198_c0_g1_i1:1359-3197(-)
MEGVRGGEDGMEYVGRREVNEVEVLYALLYRVKEAFPEVEAVGTGAILSNYQRLRVEHVCSRLGLISLAYLWERDQTELLSEMISHSLHAITIKIAALGLNKNHLGKDLATLQPHLLKLNQLYQTHVCGEGGEFETFTLDCPLFEHQRIELDEVEVVEHDRSDIAPVLYLKLKKFHLVSKKGLTPEAVRVIEVDPSYRMQIPDTLVGAPRQDAGLPEAVLPFRRCGRAFYISSAPWNAQNGLSMSIESETACLFNAIRETLRRHQVSMSEVFYINVYLRDMADFAKMNAIYKQYFSSGPPSRACVAIDWPYGASGVIVECYGWGDTGKDVKRTLHVQSISEWAPACIGPYSQANVITINSSTKLISFAGQIAMNPPDLSLDTSKSVREQIGMSTTHQRRIEEALRISPSFLWKYAFVNLYGKNGEGMDLEEEMEVVTKNLGKRRGGLLNAVGIKAFPKGGNMEVQCWAVVAEGEDTVQERRRELNYVVEDVPFSLRLHFITDNEDFAACQLTLSSPSPVLQGSALQGAISKSLEFFLQALSQQGPERPSQILSLRAFYQQARTDPPTTSQQIIQAIQNSKALPEDVGPFTTAIPANFSGKTLFALQSWLFDH